MAISELDTEHTNPKHLLRDIVNPYFFQYLRKALISPFGSLTDTKINLLQVRLAVFTTSYFLFF